jgi:bifunctional DNA-binding transcriptional regulator/antitoxin component of YhaV-PrlF toxin-antitoxin module
MKSNLMVSSKGQITLPVTMRKALGLTGENAFVTVEQKGGKIVLTPAMVVETEIYSDEDIVAWSKADEFAPGERQAVDRALKKRASRR